MGDNDGCTGAWLCERNTGVYTKTMLQVTSMVYVSVVVKDRERLYKFIITSDHCMMIMVGVSVAQW